MVQDRHAPVEGQGRGWLADPDRWVTGVAGAPASPAAGPYLRPESHGGVVLEPRGPKQSPGVIQDPTGELVCFQHRRPARCLSTKRGPSGKTHSTWGAGLVPCHPQPEPHGVHPSPSPPAAHPATSRALDTPWLHPTPTRPKRPGVGFPAPPRPRGPLALQPLGLGLETPGLLPAGQERAMGISNRLPNVAKVMLMTARPCGGGGSSLSPPHFAGHMSLCLWLGHPVSGQGNGPGAQGWILRHPQPAGDPLVRRTKGSRAGRGGRRGFWAQPTD